MMMKFCEDTEKLLRQRGLKCICQLCNCGRPHHHKGCRKTLANMMNLSMHHGKNSNNKMVTDYQSEFGTFRSDHRREPIRPVQRARDPNPPAMDFRTENHDSYKQFGDIERMKPCKLQGEIEKLSSGDFMDCTVYKDSYPAHQLQQHESLRPATVFKPSLSNEFQKDTEYVKSFGKKNKVSQEIFTEGPVLAYGLMYPDGGTVAKKSLKNSIHDGRAGEKAKTYIPTKDDIQLGTEENANNFQTTSHEHFKKYELSHTKSTKPSYEMKARSKFTAVSQNKVDFKYDEIEAKMAKGNIYSEYPSLIKLSMDVPLDFQTINRMSYNSKSAVPQNTSTKPIAAYIPPADKFNATTTNQSDFKDFGNIRRVGMIKQPVTRKSSAKIQGNSSYMSQFKNPGRINRVLYGEQNEDNLRLPPKTEQFTKKTVTGRDFQAQNGAEKAKAFKPEYTLHNGGGKLQSNTEYSDTFKSNEFDLCAFPRYLAEEEVRKMTVK